MLVRKASAVEEENQFDMFSVTHVMWIESTELMSVESMSYMVISPT
jgi:hypothetical protein